MGGWMCLRLSGALWQEKSRPGRVVAVAHDEVPCKERA